MKSKSSNSKELRRRIDPSEEQFNYPTLLSQIKARIRVAQSKAVFSANSELLLLYWDIGRMLTKRQAEKGWGFRVYRRLSLDIRNELAEVKGFSERNLNLMGQFYREYPEFGQFMQQPVAQIMDGKSISNPLITQKNLVQQLVALLPWGHNIILIQKLKNLEVRLWYVEQTR